MLVDGPALHISTIACHSPSQYSVFNSMSQSMNLGYIKFVTMAMKGNMLISSQSNKDTCVDRPWHLMGWLQMHHKQIWTKNFFAAIFSWLLFYYFFLIIKYDTHKKNCFWFWKMFMFNAFLLFSHNVLSFNKLN